MDIQFKNKNKFMKLSKNGKGIWRNPDAFLSYIKVSGMGWKKKK